MRKRRSRQSKGTTALRPSSRWHLPFTTGRVQLRPAPEALVLPLRRSSRLRLALRILSLGVLGYVLELILTGHALAAGAVALMSACGSWRWRRRPGGAGLRQLVVATDGRLFLGTRDGSMEEMQLRPQSLRLGPHVLLVLAARGHVHRLLLGPDNLTPAQLSALKCRLPMRPAPTGTALHSPAAPRRSDAP